MEKGSEIRHEGAPMVARETSAAAVSSPSNIFSIQAPLNYPRLLFLLAAAALLIVIGIHLYQPAPQASSSPKTLSGSEAKSNIDSLAAVITKTYIDDPLERELTGLIKTVQLAYTLSAE